MRYPIALILIELLTSGVFARNIRIVGGLAENARKHPFIASFKSIDDHKVFCGGSIISNRHILTAAQCFNFHFKNLRHIRVYTGIVPPDSNPGNGHEINEVYKHPGFTAKRNREEMYLHDIAVVKLKEILQLNAIQNIIGLPNRDIADNDKGFILGWGSTSYPLLSFPVQLQKAKMSVIEKKRCSNAFDFKLHESQFCASNRIGIGPCSGDGGNPLIIDGKLAGITSVSIPCAAGAPDIFIKVHYYIDFIRNMMNN